MRVPLIYLSVIMILSFVACSDDIEDLSKGCINGRTMYYNLSTGVGSRDMLIARKATEGKINCTLKFIVKTGNYIMITLQFPDMKEHEKVCYIENNTSIIVRDDINNGFCLERNSTPYCRFSKENVSFHIRSDDNISAVKVSVASMRDVAVLNCSQNKENGCFAKFEVLQRFIKCKRFGAARDPDRNREDTSLSLPVVICSLVMTIITFFLLFSIAMSLVPKRKDPYIHAFDQSMALFDCENGIVTVEVNIIILFPPEKTSFDRKTK